MKSYNKKAEQSDITACLAKSSEAHLIDVNGKDTKLILAVKSNILCYSLTEETFLSTYEGHANHIQKLRFMEYTIDQKKEIDDIKNEYFISMATDEQILNLWKSSKKEQAKVITSPLKMLELKDKKQCIDVQMKQIAGQYYFAQCVTTHSVWGYVCNLKVKGEDKNMLKKCDYKVTLDNSLTKKNIFIISSKIVSESELVILKGNSQVLEVHQMAYLDEEGQSPGTDLKIELDSKATNGHSIDKNGDVEMLGLEYDQVQQKASKIENGVLEGIDIDKLQGKVETILQGKRSKAIKTGSLVAVLEQSLHANDIETINWVLSNVDVHVITETIKKVKKDTLQQLMQNILIKLQQGVQKASLLWLSIVLKLRWIDVIKFMTSQSTVHSAQSLSTIHTYLNRKTKNLSKYFEVRAKLQMVIENGEAMLSGDLQDAIEADEESKQDSVVEVGANSKFTRESHQVEQDSDDSEDIDEVVEDVDAVNDQRIEAGSEEGDSEDVDFKDALEQYGDEVFDEDEDDDLEMDVDEDDEDDDDEEA